MDPGRRLDRSKVAIHLKGKNKLAAMTLNRLILGLGKNPIVGGGGGGVKFLDEKIFRPVLRKKQKKMKLHGQQLILHLGSERLLFAVRVFGLPGDLLVHVPVGVPLTKRVLLLVVPGHPTTL